MAYLTYNGPADVVLFQGDETLTLRKLRVVFSHTHTYSRTLFFIPDHPERQVTTRVRVTLPDGTTSEGRVTYTKPGKLVFREPDPYYAERGIQEPYFE